MSSHFDITDRSVVTISVHNFLWFLGRFVSHVPFLYGSIKSVFFSDILLVLQKMPENMLACREQCSQLLSPLPYLACAAGQGAARKILHGDGSWAI